MTFLFVAVNRCYSWWAWGSTRKLWKDHLLHFSLIYRVSIAMLRNWVLEKDVKLLFWITDLIFQVSPGQVSAEKKLNWEFFSNFDFVFLQFATWLAQTDSCSASEFQTRHVGCASRTNHSSSKVFLPPRWCGSASFPGILVSSPLCRFPFLERWCSKILTFTSSFCKVRTYLGLIGASL